MKEAVSTTPVTARLGPSESGAPRMTAQEFLQSEEGRREVAKAREFAKRLGLRSFASPLPHLGQRRSR
jgi:hypothetical protein